MLTQYEYDNSSSQKSCYSSDTNATVSVVQRYLTTTTTTNVISSTTRIQNSIPNIKVESCTKEFLAKNFNDAYPMFKNPRGQCLIINVYNINGAVRRWSDLDVKLLSDLFRQLYFNVIVYSDFNGDDLRAENFKKILKQFSQSKEHANAQCSIICLMSHGEEGSLTVQDGNKIYHDHVFDLFSNVNCPHLAGKPKLFFIQCCRDDPGVGPVDDAGCHVQIPSNTSFDDLVFDDDDECDSMQRHHLPTMTDMLIAFPSQKGFTAFRKPHVGSWYMNALVDILARHAKDTDLCSMLNMVNGCVSREVTNKGKKQTAEYKSSFTKKAFYFFPGLTGNPITPIDYSIHNRNDVSRIEIITNNIDHQHDSSSISFDIIKNYFIENLLDKWKYLARELDVDEKHIDMISKENISLKQKFSLILDIVAKIRHNDLRQILIDMLNSLKQCRRMSHYYQLREIIAPFYPDLQ
ncbi:unnamed protein product [Adineta steineri]|uniref:Uncharacterized protein n=1 Tax=Adineta steineri TaxID=433720 RepID=A0A818TR65_9BILA|nr:unnamed protein product [Adineta steineri]